MPCVSQFVTSAHAAPPPDHTHHGQPHSLYNLLYIYKYLSLSFFFCSLPIAMLVLGRGRSPYIQTGCCLFFCRSKIFALASGKKTLLMACPIGELLFLLSSCCGRLRSTFARILVGWAAVKRRAFIEFYFCLLCFSVFAFNCCI